MRAAPPAQALCSCRAQRGEHRGPRMVQGDGLSLLWSPRSQALLLIMLTSLAPSPMAKVTAFLYFFTSSTT